MHSLDTGNSCARHPSVHCMSAQCRPCVQQDMGETSPGDGDDLHWLSGWRTALSDDFCVSGAVPVWPYFTPTSSGTASDYNGCGTDPLQDWVWRSWQPDGRMVEQPFTQGALPHTVNAACARSVQCMQCMQGKQLTCWHELREFQRAHACRSRELVGGPGSYRRACNGPAERLGWAVLAAVGRSV
jgi:hypothetical protein